MPDEASQHMTCMEIWGGNQSTENQVTMSGLDAWVYCRPFGQSDGGGDVYYVSSCATGRITRLLLADVSGHGAVVAQTAVELRRLMQKYVNYIDQTAFVGSMNRQFAELSQAGTFATAIVSTFFAPTNDLTLCIAGHPAPLLYRAADRQWTVLDRSDRGQVANIPLGIDDVSEWAQFGVRLEVGDFVLCYTDSLSEAHGADGEMLGPSGLRSIASDVNAGDPNRMIGTLLNAIASRADGNLSNDDVTVLLFRPNGKATAVPLRDRVLAPLRIAREVYGSFMTMDRPAPWPEFSLASLGGAMFQQFNRLWSRRNMAMAAAHPTLLRGAPAPKASQQSPPASPPQY